MLMDQDTKHGGVFSAEIVPLIENCTNICLDSKDPDYQIYNILVSGIILPIIGLIGLVGNTFVIIVYLNADQRKHSTSIYLGALGVSDFLMICNAMFLFVLEAWRHTGPKSLAIWYGQTAPISFPLAAIFQTTSVYFCVGAAIDAFVYVVLPKVVSEMFCTAKRAKSFVVTITISAVFYNIPHFLEIHAIDCLDSSGDLSLQICPTSFRQNALYYTIYYTYMYTVIMAVGPLVLLIILNIFVVYHVIRRPKDPDSDIISLILVVCLFIFCNFMALLVNFLELTLYEQLQHFIVYLVDLSNLLVVINCTANFFVYLAFGKSFRRALADVCHKQLPCHFQRLTSAIIRRQDTGKRKKPPPPPQNNNLKMVSNPVRMSASTSPTKFFPKMPLHQHQNNDERQMTRQHLLKPFDESSSVPLVAINGQLKNHCTIII